MKLTAAIFAIFASVCLCFAPVLVLGGTAAVTTVQTVAGVLAGWTGAAVFTEF